jgi:hypothetical protein
LEDVRVASPPRLRGDQCADAEREHGESCVLLSDAHGGLQWRSRNHHARFSAKNV